MERAGRAIWGSDEATVVGTGETGVDATVVDVVEVEGGAVTLESGAVVGVDAAEVVVVVDVVVEELLDDVVGVDPSAPASGEAPAATTLIAVATTAAISQVRSARRPAVMARSSILISALHRSEASHLVG